MQPPPSPVAIVGGGITGLTAAFRLHQHNIPFTLYESSPRLGGVIQSLHKDGYLAEFGPNTILETSPIIPSLIRDLGLIDRRLYSNPNATNRYIVRRSRPVPLPASPLQFITSSLFSTTAKLQLLREPFVRPAPAHIEENLAQFVLRRLGQEFLDYAINPFVAGVYAGDPARLSVIEAFPKLHALEQKYGSLIKGQILGAKDRRRRPEVSKQSAPKFSFLHGLQELIDALQSHLLNSVHTESTVIDLQPASNQWLVTHRTHHHNIQQPHSAVLLAAPTHKLARIPLHGTTQLNLAPLQNIYYPPVASVVLGFHRRDVAHPLDGFGMLIPQIEGFNILGTIFNSSLFPNRAPENHVTLTSYVGGTRAPDLAHLPTQQLVDLTTQDLRSILGVRAPPTFSHCVLYPHAIPQYDVGYGRFRRIMSDLESLNPGLFLAGHFRDGISLGDSIVSGHNVAQRILNFLQHPKLPPSHHPDLSPLPLP